ncbi:General substrate transporter [Niveomyces insectorum RCEF 264]|uniref:General substrate transporter n=1 Tax=Niveomyces insectorum RCEF 264 TaxID=1081102 RepID=A0A167UXC4_9HYPO|nr:General substrate transporter [Niveomyces insectorum RCEF 264]
MEEIQAVNSGREQTDSASDPGTRKTTGTQHVEDGFGDGYVDINENLDARIRNPLQGLSYQQLMHKVDVFAEQKGLTEHRLLLRKGALVAQDPTGYEDIDGPEALTDEEKAALLHEATHRWSMPWRLFMTIFTCSIGAAVQGWDQTGVNGAAIFFPDYYGIGSDSVRDKFLVGLVSSAPYIGCATIGCWLSDPLNHYIGRRGVIFAAAQLCLWPIIGSAFCENWWQQLILRILMGVGMGAKASTVPVFAAENAPASIRGALVMSWQMWTAFGILLGTAINLAVYHVGSHNWRLMLGAPFIPAVPLVILIYFCPESPRWYMKKDRYPDAWKSMVVLRHTPLQAARDIYYIHAQLEIELLAIGDSNYLQRVIELFTIPRVRRASIAAFVVMIAQQMCGINIIAFYSTTVFTDAGFSQFRALLCSFGFGLVNWVFAFPAFWTIDTFGRRSLLLLTFPNMMWTLLTAGLCTLVTAHEAKLALVALFVFMFAAFYSPGEGPVPFTYSAEVFPLSHREIGMGFAVATCLGWAAVLSVSFPFILSSLGTVGAFCLYAGFNGVAFFMIFFCVPETKQRTLEELDYVFAVPFRTFIRYQVFTFAPWWIRRYILFQRHTELPPLYHFERTEHAQRTGAAAGNNVGGTEKTEKAESVSKES